MSRSVDQRIADILQSIDRCRRYADALDSNDRDLVDMAEDAVERNLQIIGESAKHLPAEVTDAHPEIAWPQIRGLRNILVDHGVAVLVAAHDPQLIAAARSVTRLD